ncbi:hypothetical protein [uncultured Croceitalea sp.]|uniref:hypothetical protein n=1 Tax=uncultured Croceitalea sp. TaxID=1798908 RepID=UPI00330601DD
MNLIGNIQLSDNQNHQAIYSSQLYGTFFMIYAKFTCQAPYKISAIDLHIFNYKGLIDIGITRARYVPETNEKKKIVGGHIIVEVKAFHKKHQVLVDMGGKVYDCPLKGFIEVERRVAKQSKALNNGFFDNEFYYREGFERNSQGGYDQKIQNRTPVPDSDYTLPPQGPVGGVICPRSKNRVL